MNFFKNFFGKYDTIKKNIVLENEVKNIYIF